MTAAQRIARLRDEGYAVHVSHRRLVEGLPGLTTRARLQELRALAPGRGLAFTPKGGETRVWIERDGLHAAGIAHCSAEDNFSRRRGLEIALGRALKMLERLTEARAARSAA